MNTLWRLGKTTRPGAESPKELAPVEWPPLRNLGDFATEATFTAPHTDDELLARRLWRNVEYYQTNYVCLLGVGLLLSVATDSFTLVRLVGLAVGFVVILHVAADRGALPTEDNIRRRWLGLVNGVASRIGAAETRGRPEPTAAVSAVVILLMVPLGLLFFFCKMRWAIWAWVGVVAHILARKPNTLSKLFHAAGSLGARDTRTPALALAEYAVAAARAD